MTGENVDNTPSGETEWLIEKALVQEWIQLYEHFNKILFWCTSSFGSKLANNPMRNAFDKVIPFKMQMSLNILNLEGNIDAEYVDN